VHLSINLCHQLSFACAPLRDLLPGVRLSAAQFRQPAQKFELIFGSVPEAVNQGCEIILDFVTDNKYYFTGNSALRADGKERAPLALLWVALGPVPHFGRGNAWTD